MADSWVLTPSPQPKGFRFYEVRSNRTLCCMLWYLRKIFSKMNSHTSHSDGIPLDSTPPSDPMSEPLSSPLSSPPSDPMSESLSSPPSDPMSESLSAPLFDPMSAPMSAPLFDPLSESLPSSLDSSRLSPWLSSWLSPWLSSWLSPWLSSWLSPWLSPWLSSWLSSWLSPWPFPLFNSLSCRLFSPLGICLLSLSFLLSPSKAFAKTALEGTFRLRSVASQSHKKKFFSFFMRDRLYVEGEFRPDNKTAARLGFSSSSTYGQKLSLAETVKIYPSGSFSLTEDMELKLGWNLYENKFPEIASVNNYEDFVYAFQGVFLEYSARFMNVSFWGGWPPELPKSVLTDSKPLEQDSSLQQAPAESPDLALTDSKSYQNFGFGFFLDLDLSVDFVDYVSLYAAYLGDSSIKKGEEMGGGVDSTQQKVSRYGAGLKGNFYLLNLSYTAVAAFYGKGFQFGNWGEESMYHLKLGFSRPDFFNGKIVAGWHKDSPKYRSWLYNRHENAGLLDLFLWGNLSYYFLGLSASLTDEIDIEFFITDFRSTEKGPIQLGQFGLLQAEQMPEGESLESQGTQLGREVDMRLGAKIDDYFEVGLMAGLFFPGSGSRTLFLKEKFYNNIQLTGLYKF